MTPYILIQVYLLYTDHLPSLYPPLPVSSLCCHTQLCFPEDIAFHREEPTHLPLPKTVNVTSLDQIVSGVWDYHPDITSQSTWVTQNKVGKKTANMGMAFCGRCIEYLENWPREREE